MKCDFRMGPWLVEPSRNTVYHKRTSPRLEPKAMEVPVSPRSMSALVSVPPDGTKTSPRYADHPHALWVGSACCAGERRTQGADTNSLNAVKPPAKG